VNVRPVTSLATCALAVALFMVGVLAGKAHGQDRPARPLPRIGDHRFLESDLVPLPMPTTNLLSSLGAGGASNARVAIFDNVDSLPPREIDGSLAYLTLNLSYQQAVNDWLAPWIAIGMSGRLGTNSVSLVSEGVVYQYSWELGWLIKVHEWQRARLAATANLWRTRWGFIQFEQWLRDVIANGGIREGNELYRESPSLSGGGGLRYAYAVNATLGLAAVVEGGVGEEPNASAKTAGFFRGSVMADVDLNGSRHVPIGFGLGFRYASVPGAEPGVRLDSNQGIFRIEYTGREEFAVALETQFGSLPLTSGDSAFITQTKLVTRYYF
jgi:hypothetical protein